MSEQTELIFLPTGFYYEKSTRVTLALFEKRLYVCKIKSKKAHIDNEEVLKRNQEQIKVELSTKKLNLSRQIYILPMYCFQTETEAIFLMECCACDGADLYHLHKYNSGIYGKCLDTYQIVNIFQQLLHALACLAEKKVIHRDIKPENIFCKFRTDGLVLVRIGDFDHSKIYQNGMMNTVKAGTPHYTAPQALKNGNYSYQYDLWAVFMVVYQLHFKRFPFASGKHQQNHKIQTYEDRQQSYKNNIIAQFPEGKLNVLEQILKSYLTIEEKPKMSVEEHIKFVNNLIETLQTFKNQLKLFSPFNHYNDIFKQQYDFSSIQVLNNFFKLDEISYEKDQIFKKKLEPFYLELQAFYRHCLEAKLPHQVINLAFERYRDKVTAMKYKIIEQQKAQVIEQQKAQRQQEMLQSETKSFKRTQKYNGKQNGKLINYCPNEKTQVVSKQKEEDKTLVTRRLFFDKLFSQIESKDTQGLYKYLKKKLQYYDSKQNKGNGDGHIEQKEFKSLVQDLQVPFSEAVFKSYLAPHKQVISIQDLVQKIYVQNYYQQMNAQTGKHPLSELKLRQN